MIGIERMGKAKNCLGWIAIVFFAFVFTYSQPGRRTNASVAGDRCSLNGTYRIDVSDSDQLYSVVRNARSSVPFADQQQFFMDLSTRLTPPDMLAIECIGRRVSVGSSRAAKITYLADGRNRREKLPGGSFVDSKISMTGNSLTFVSVGNVEDNVNVAFESLGDRMLVTRRIYAKQLPEPIVIRTYYDRISTAVEWNIYDRGLVAANPAAQGSSRPAGRGSRPAENNRLDLLRTELVAWIDATNRRDINEQMRFYVPQLSAYYLTRNTPMRAVRAEKERVFSGVRSVDIRIGEPEIALQDDGRTAVMRFVKEYRVTERTRVRRGAVIQELRWRQTADGWKIFSERDVRVIR